jgi:alpha-glucosidase
MENNDPKRKEDVKDPEGRAGWPKEIGRDGERTPMQWNESANAGFSKAKPWLPVPPSYKTHTVASEMKDQNSVLSFYRQLLALRRNEPALLEGDYTPINQDDAHVLAYLRRYKDEAILVLLNMSASDQQVRFDLSPLGFATPKLSLLLTSFHKPLTGASDALPMEPYSVFVAKITK